MYQKKNGTRINKFSNVIEYKFNMQNQLYVLVYLQQTVINAV